MFSSSIFHRPSLPGSLFNNVESFSPLIMGILNVTPDSACQTGRFEQISQAIVHAQQMILDGANIIDIGGESTNPGVNPKVSLEEELARVIPIVTQLRKETDIPISVDTSKPEVMAQALAAGANLINDVRALTVPGALEVVSRAKVPVCLMHMRFPNGMPDAPIHYHGDIIHDVKTYLHERKNSCIEAGINPENIILDPGIGHGNFGKDTRQNLLLLKHLDEFLELESPLLVCVSRKTFIGNVLNLPIEDRVNASVVGAVLALIQGASIIRVHDVKQTKEAIKLSMAIMEVQ